MTNAIKENNKNLLLISGCVFLALIIFITDLHLPLGIAGGVPYVAVILWGLWLPSKRYILVCAIGCSVLTILGYYFSPPGGELWMVIINRIFALFAIWITVLLCIEEKKHKVELIKAKKSLETRSNTILDHACDGIITISASGIIDSLNIAAEHLFGYKAQEILGKNINVLMPEPYASEHDQYIKNYLESGVSKIIGIGREVIGLRKDGTTFPLDLSVSEMYVEETRMFTGIVRDISERKKAVSILELTKNELDNNRIQLQATLDGIAEAIITIDEQGYIRSVNPAVESIFQYPPSILVGTNIKILMPEPYASEHDQYIKNYLESGIAKIIGIRREALGLRKDGTTFPLELAISEIYLGETRMFTGIIRDITHKKEAEEKLEKANRKTEQILNSAGEGIYGLDLEGNTTFANTTAEKILGYKEEELLGKLQHSLIHHSKPDGTPYPREDCHIYAALKDGKVHQESEEVFWRKEGTPVPVEYVSTPITENGKLVGAVVTFKDISERKRTERMISAHTKDLKKANEMLFHSNKELDDFAYIVSHDLKEPLRGIFNYSSFIKEDYSDKLDEDGRSKLETLERLSKRMEALINSILYFSRLGRSEEIFEPVDLNTVLSDTLENMQSLILESNVDVRLPEHFPKVFGNETRIGEVFQNLIANAIKYNDKPDKWVEVGCILNGDENGQDACTGTDSAKSPDNPPPVFYVRDNGIGILEKHFDSLFRIFKRLNGRHKFSDGTGAGTTIVKKIIEQHNGKIWLESKVGEGSTFYFTLGEKKGNETYQPKPNNSYS
jgi:two-component system sensor kinase FixL